MMNGHTKLDPLEYFPSKNKIMISFISSGAFIIGGAAICYFTRQDVIGWILIGIAVAVLFSMRKAATDHRPMLRIDARGLALNTGPFDIDLLWSEIEQCRGNNQHGMDSVCVYLKDPQAILEKQNVNAMRKKMHASNIKNMGTFVFFPTSIINMNTIELLKILEHYRKTANKIE